jgi:hypothetical protein
LIYQLRYGAITCTGRFKEPGAFFHLKLCLRHHVYFILSVCIKGLSHISFITMRFAFLDYLYVLYFRLHISNLEYGTVVPNFMVCTDANELEHIQQKLSICSIFFHHVPQSSAMALEKSSLHSVQVYRGLKFITSLLENVSVHVHTCSDTDLSTCGVCP